MEFQNNVDGAAPSTETEEYIAPTSGIAMTGVKFAAAAAAFAAFSKRAEAQTATDVLDVLQFAYILENFEAEFYKSATNTGTNVNATQANRFVAVRTAIAANANSAAILAALDQIRKHEEAHVRVIGDTIRALGGTPPTLTGASFDFTGGNGTHNGPFVGVFSNLQVLMLAAQVFEDLGVRAYKGQAGRLINNELVLETALRIHSVEARHAAKIRKVRRMVFNAPTSVRLSGTIRQSEFGAPPGVTLSADAVAAVQAVYGNPAAGSIANVTAPESNTTHRVNNGTMDVDINAADLAGIFGGADAVTEAFDEALSKAQVLAIVDPFVLV